MSSLFTKYSLVLLLASVLHVARGQSVQFKHITINEGLTHNHVTSVFKASDGFLWIGTPVGLNRLDGHAVRVYKNRPGDFSTLKDNAVSQIFEGPLSQLWVRTGLGLNVLDVRRDAVLGNTDSLLQSLGIPAGNILDIRKDKSGYYWFLHEEAGLIRYDAQQNISVRYAGRQTARPTGLALGTRNSVWVIYADGTLETVHTLSLETQSVRQLQNTEASEYRVMIDRNNDPWIYTVNTPSGVYWWPDFSVQPEHFSVYSGGLNNNTVIGLAEDPDGRIWIATDHGGVNLFDSRSRKMSYLMYEEFNDRSLSHNGTSTIFCDEEGMVWVGTYKGGVNYYHDNLLQFPVYRHHSTAPVSLPYDDVNRLVEDHDGNLWIGTNGGGLIFYDKQRNSYRQYLHSPDDPFSIGSNVIVSLLLDRRDNLWVGTYHGGLNLFRNGKFIRYLHDPADPKSISNNSVWELFEDSKNRLWIGTLFGGINLMDRENGTFEKPGNALVGPEATYICSILEDKAGNLWFGSATGIEVLEAGGRNITSYTFDPNRKDGLSNAYISDLLQDSKGRIWVATRDGLNLFRPETGTFRVLRDTDGLRDNTIHTLLEDNAGKIWMSTSKGLSVVSESKGEEWVIRNFDQQDGLQAVAFNENAAVKLRSGELIFGGPAGFNRIRPEEISHEEALLRPVISDLLLFNRSVGVGEEINGRVLLKEAIAYTREIVLKYDQNVFSLAISPLYFLHPERVRIKYNLEGFSREWLELDPKSRLATFTNLNAGEYHFKVITSADGEQWSDPVTLLKIVIRPPFWLTGWAYAFYVLCAGGLLLAVRFMERRRQYTRFVLQQEREEARRLKELDQLKTKFFTNVSHEFRTPVSLIISPIEKLAREEKDPGRKMHLDLVHRNARRLLNLVNQLLDFRKIDTRSLQLQNTEGDIMAQVRDHARSFLDMAESKEIDYCMKISGEGGSGYFDHEKLERIVFNLLSNAFKFTPVGGKVMLAAELEKDLEGGLKLVVEDTGIGIAAESLPKIFERYYQDDILHSLLNQGSGIGLSITREYVELMGGKIEVESEADKGSRFTVWLPVHAAGAGPEPLMRPGMKTRGRGKRVLVVEDNEDFRFYMLDNLREHYHVEEARNFSEGWDKALTFHPDIIVSDVNMPGNSGIELCRKLKADRRTMHIPVILLTALTADQYQLEGTEAGAADYIVKPFNVELLLSKIKSHIRQKTTFEKTYKRQLAVEPATAEVESVDEKFMRKTLEVVEKNIANTLFSVEMLADEMNVSRVGLYKKVFSLTGYSPSEFIRNIRLKRAARLLEETGLTVAEVAYEVGFNNPKVFSRYFKDIFGELPSGYKKGS